MKYLLYALVMISCFSGMIFFAWYYEIILISFSQKTRLQPAITQQQTISLWYFKGAQWHQELQSIIHDPHDLNLSAQKIVEQWIATVFNHGLIYKKVSVQSVTYNSTGSDIYISFDRTLFHQQQSTYQKIMLINALGKTLQKNGITAQRMHLFVQHVYLSDPHLLCNYGLPTTGF